MNFHLLSSSLLLIDRYFDIYWRARHPIEWRCWFTSCLFVVVFLFVIVRKFLNLSQESILCYKQHNHLSNLNHVWTESLKCMYIILWIDKLTLFLLFRNIIHPISIHQNYLVLNVQKMVNLPFVWWLHVICGMEQRQFLIFISLF
jgi:hypothetical protein